ncbi:MAG TPA: hydrogenase small subunit [Bacteroidota bacterium]|nr:hydrogenase small subunit [Bacteroidota bacterium]
MSRRDAISRREFVRWAVAVPAALSMADELFPRLAYAIQDAVKEYPIIWLQASTCSGCSVSVINTIHPSIKNVILEQVLPGHQLILSYHGTLMAATGSLSVETARATAQKFKKKYILVVEGAIPTAHAGGYGTIGEEDGHPVTMLKWTDSLGRDAMAVLTVGTCAAYGGIPAAAPNPSGCKGVSEIFADLGIATPVINIPGCPCHPDWFIGTVAKILLYGMPQPKELDEYGRMKLFFGRSVHNRCINRDYLDEGIFASTFGEEGCLLELGCKGPFTNADCPIRLWNGGVSWCINAGAPCIGCTEKGFPDAHSPIYQRR